MTINKIDSEEQFNELLNKETFLLFKHSLTCPVSAEAYEQYEKYMAANEELKTAYLAVQEARPLSNYVAETFDIKHQSPQVILFKNGKPAWNESHWRITYDSLTKAISE
ncbi:bacillithiol system redox-active protein YtxJ [Peribacillus sp. TH16]|uniref:bacillithiol system redox-active protein YtxJ n=1 Tax=Peribacillus TaxID=2675229 RepID=UPI0019138633|nr:MULTISPECIES: bacillithiol system redox-active protein YtxJ [unclassified Peribacillus]MBK5442973.1 bacillithiol system redox-active protein YtxJ [Peribacillus sp. TH24]MBK5462288.1 bacillithiol system redox-active protein YtxJ [Peribacillus sp. TH27]MBK5484375.1 bacillithiol system redox-active protein YtxJ [Peribacillus sp. TH16]WMX54531.1 bacillithiol system redox-active protein YtxJ [Peribacillus sp. R9-11]